MKKLLLSIVLPICAFMLISWGRTGHSTIGLIAEHHLTSKAKASIGLLLGGQTISDVASWADEVRGNDPAYSNTASWHFINVPVGLTFHDFEMQVENSSKDNVYSALQKAEIILKNPKATNMEKAIALKFIIHFVGDIHQPMHVSRAEDKGGNTIQVQYDGQGSNLHSLWDTKLLEHSGLNYQLLAEKFDHASAEQISKWQSDPQIIWAWESYQVSTQLYQEIDQQGRNIDNAYYELHMPVIENRIEKAGIRLAGLLNAVFEQAPVSGQVNTATATGKVAQIINIDDATSHINENVTLTAKVYGTKDIGNMILVNMGAAYPNQPLTVVLRDGAKNYQDKIDGKTITVTGQLVSYKDKPEIIVIDPSQIVIN